MRINPPSPSSTQSIALRFASLEDIHYGERVRRFDVEILTDSGWEPFFEAHCIGHKRIIPVGRAVRGVRLNIREAVDTPIIKDMTLYR